MEQPSPFEKWVELQSISELRPHPKNYRKHPQDQLDHIVASIKANGFYRNIVAARDLTILAGHGVVQAAEQMGLTEVPVVRLDIDPDSTAALKIIAGDNEIGRRAEADDRALTDLLKEVLDADLDGLLGTGFDEAMLANLVMVTRPASELKDFNAAAEWVGMPEYEDGSAPIKLIITFPNESERDRFFREYPGIEIDGYGKKGKVWATRWPYTEVEDVAGLKFEAAEDECEEEVDDCEDELEDEEEVA